MTISGLYKFVLHVSFTEKLVMLSCKFSTGGRGREPKSGAANVGQEKYGRRKWIYPKPF